MITEKLHFYGDKEEAEGIRVLVKKCLEELSCQVTDTLVYICKPDESAGSEESASQVVLDYEYIGCVSETMKVFTYSFGDSRSNVTALNEQKKESYTCFELLSGISMSRIFISDAYKLSVKQVLVCTAILCSMGVTAEKTVETINGLLK